MNQAASRCLKECIVIAQKTSNAQQVVGLLTLVDSWIDGYDPAELVDLVYDNTNKHWEELSGMTGDADAGKVMYKFTCMFPLKAMYPGEDRVVKGLLEGDLEPKRRETLKTTLRDMVIQTILHVHAAREPQEHEDKKSYAKQYKQELKVQHWARKFSVTDKLKFMKKICTESHVKKKRSLSDDDAESSPVKVKQIKK